MIIDTPEKLSQDTDYVTKEGWILVQTLLYLNTYLRTF